MRYLPLSDADRSAMLEVDRRRVGRRSVRRRARGSAARRADPRPADARQRNGGRAPARRDGAQEHGRGRSALLPRLRRVQASRPGERRPSHPARRIPHRLHALPARNRAGHAAGPVRIPDPGRAAARLRGRQCVDVRRLDRLLGSDRHGAADHAAEEGDRLVGAPPALCRGVRDDGQVHRRHARPRHARRSTPRPMPSG